MTVGHFSLRGKIVVVTGGGSGISLAFVQLAASQGAKVLIADLRLTNDAEDFLKASRNDNNNVVFTKCDVTVWTELQNLILVSEKEFGDVPDVYVAGAGVFEPPWSNFWSDTETTHYASIDINISHPIKLTRIAIRALLSRNKPGVVLIVSSAAGLVGIYPAALYSATKHAMVGFTKSLGPADREEGVKVVCICPGMVDTPLWRSSPAQMAQFSYTPTIALPASAIATAMAELICEEEYPGGTVLSIGLGLKEVLEYVGEEGKVEGGMEGKGGKEGKEEEEEMRGWWDSEEVKGKRWGPLREILKREREGGGKGGT